MGGLGGSGRERGNGRGRGGFMCVNFIIQKPKSWKTSQTSPGIFHNFLFLMLILFPGKKNTFFLYCY